MSILFPYILHDIDTRYQENCLLENCLPENCPPSQKIALQKITPDENTPLWILPTMKIPPNEYYPLWKLPPGKITPNEISSPIINHTNERKNKITKFFYLEGSCAIQHPYQNNQGLLWYTDDLTENTGLRYFLYRMKKIQKSNIYLPGVQVKEN